MKIAFGTDEVTPLTEHVLEYLRAQGHDVDEAALDESWPDVGHTVGEAVASGDADRGIVCCWTGTGVAMAANKVSGARAALCTDSETAQGARKWNDANVLAFGVRLTSPALAEEMIDAFLTTSVDATERSNIDMLDQD